jgi:uncharacterized coiled-coil protein SlyX
MYHAVTQKPHIDPDEPSEEATTRKERVLHTRVPAVLERELKRLADATRMPVSNLVRAILEDALSVAERAGGRVEEQLRHVAERMSKERESIRETVRRLDPLERVVAFQPVVLAHPVACTRCARRLEAGDDARLGVSTEPGPLIFVCPACVPTRGAQSPPKEGEVP